MFSWKYKYKKIKNTGLRYSKIKIYFIERKYKKI